MLAIGEDRNRKARALADVLGGQLRFQENLAWRMEIHGPRPAVPRGAPRAWPHLILDESASVDPLHTLDFGDAPPSLRSDGSMTSPTSISLPCPAHLDICPAFSA
jgi:hypothetical protein